MAGKIETKRMFQPSGTLRGGRPLAVAMMLMALGAAPALAIEESATLEPAANVEPRIFGDGENLREQENGATPKPAYMTEDQPLRLRDYAEPQPAQPEPWWQQLLGFLLKLVIVLGLVVVSLVALKRMNGGKAILPNARSRNIVVLETTHLAPNQAMHLVSIGGERLLVVGAGPQGLTTLSEITDPEEVRPFMQGQRASGASPFNQVFDLESVVQEAGGDLFNEAYREQYPTPKKRKKGWPNS